MNNQTHRTFYLALVLTSMGLTACHKPGPAEEAGRKMDEIAEQTSRTVQQVDTAVSDADITAKVKLALMMRDGLNSFTISVKTQDGVVTLSGSVAHASQSKLANDLAHAVDDVIRVDNQLLVVSPPK